MNTQLKEVEGLWPSIASVFAVPREREDYERLVGMVDDLIDETGGDENHPLAGLIETLGTLIEAYEDQHVPVREVGPIEALRALMQEHGLSQADLREIGSQGVVSELLSGKRKLNLRQIKSLSLKFGVSPAVFV